MPAADLAAYHLGFDVRDVEAALASASTKLGATTRGELLDIVRAR